MSTSIAARAPSRRESDHRSRFKLWLWIAIALGTAVLFYGVVFALNWPFTEQALVDTLQERSLRQVTVGHFHNTYFPPGCIAEDIRFLRIKHKEKPPLITIEKLILEDNYLNLLRFQHRLNTVKVIGLHVTVPAQEPTGEPSPIMPLTYSKSRTTMRIDKMLTDDAVLDLLSRAPGTQPVRIIVRKLMLRNIDTNTAVTYSAIVQNSEPPGEIRSEGSWGPWNPKQPGTTPVQGKYTYDNANLAAFKVLSGTLNSNGEFRGPLEHIAVNGKADVTDFKVTGTSHKRQLDTQFQAVVDGTSGDVFLNRVTAEFNRTVLFFKGSIAGQQGGKGKAMSVDVFSQHARIEDLVNLFISAATAPMSGDVTLHGHFGLPPGPDPFLKRLQIEGAFGIAGSKFTDKQTERELARLSVSAIKGDKEEDRENPQTVLSGLTGQVKANDGTAHLSQLSFQIPGAHASVHGTFGLMNCEVSLHGILVTKGDVADATTGIKSFLVKAISPFFRKKRHAKIVPFQITGPYGKTTVSLNLASKKK